MQICTVYVCVWIYAYTFMHLCKTEIYFNRVKGVHTPITHAKLLLDLLIKPINQPLQQNFMNHYQKQLADIF